MSDLVEKVARAMCKAKRPAINPDAKSFPMVPTFTEGEKYATGAAFPEVFEWQKHSAEARAAIAVVLKDLFNRALGWSECRQWLNDIARENGIDLNDR